MNWFKEGVEAANRFDRQNVADPDKEIPRPECPWPIYAPEGVQWMRGWNSVSQITAEGFEERVTLRPCQEGYPAEFGHLFYPSEEELSIAESLA